MRSHVRGKDSNSLLGVRRDLWNGRTSQRRGTINPPELKISRSRSPVANICVFPFFSLFPFFALIFFPFMSVCLCLCVCVSVWGMQRVASHSHDPPGCVAICVWFCMCVCISSWRAIGTADPAVCVPMSEALLSAFVEGKVPLLPPSRIPYCCAVIGVFFQLPDPPPFLSERLDIFPRLHGMIPRCACPFNGIDNSCGSVRFEASSVCKDARVVCSPHPVLRPVNGRKTTSRDVMLLDFSSSH